MKLGVIKHIRCNEDTFERTLVWMPDDMSQETFEAEVETARKDYLAFAHRFKNVEAPNDYREYSEPNFAQYPHLTVAQVQADWEAKKITWKRWDADRQQAKKKFGEYLHGRNGIKAFWEYESEHEYECDWGHNHGIQLDYSETIYD